MKRAALLLAVLVLTAGAAFLAMRNGVIPMPEFLSDGDGRREGETDDLVEPDAVPEEERDEDGELRAPPQSMLRPGDLAAGPTSAQPAAEVAKSTAASLRGVVVGEDGRPISNAKVTLAREGKSAADGTTDADGHFKVDVAPGRYDVRIAAGRDGVLVMDDVIVDGRGLEGTFKLAPAAKLHVEVMADGRGVTGVTVELRADDPGGRVIATAPTDGRGVAAFDELVAGAVVVEAFDASGFTVRKRATPKAGAESTLELPYPSFVTWTGVVRDAATLGGVEATFWLETDGPDGLKYRRNGSSDAGGVFTLSVPKGRPTALTVMSPGHATYPTGKETGPALGAIAGLRNGPLTHDIALKSGATVSGTVKGPDGHGVSGLGLNFKPERGPLSGLFTDATGRYDADSLSPGVWGVTIVSPGWYLKSGPAQVKVPASTETGPAKVTFDIDVLMAGTVSGSVSLADGSPAAAARVWLVGGRGVVRGARNTGRFLETFTASDGTFSIDDVPPVEGVRVRATWGEAEALPSDVLPLVAGALPRVRLVLSPTVKLVGRVTDLRTGAPVAGANVNADAVGEPPSRGRGSATTDADGRYEIANRIPGRWRVVANRKRDYLPGEAREFELVSGASPFTADLVLDPGLPIAGIVSNESGDAFSGVRLVLTGVEDGASAGATVTRNANTGADGAFHWTALRQGRYTLTLTRKGWTTLSVPLRGGEDRLRLWMKREPAKN